MAKVSVYDMSGKAVSELELNDAVFGIEPSESAMHQAVVNFLANQRHGTQSTLTRTEVSGGGRKPWRQKGTGRARQGSTRSPQWRHGGVALGPKPRSYSYTLNKQVKRLALLSALTTKTQDNEIVVVDNIAVDGYKTKTIVNMLSALNVDGKALIVLHSVDSNPEHENHTPESVLQATKQVFKSAANIPGVKTTYANTINVYDLLNCNKVVFVKSAVEEITEVYK